MILTTACSEAIFSHSGFTYFCVSLLTLHSYMRVDLVLPQEAPSLPQARAYVVLRRGQVLHLPRRSVRAVFVLQHALPQAVARLEDLVLVQEHGGDDEEIRIIIHQVLGNAVNLLVHIDYS